MAGRSTIMGFTEAELGFVLAAAFIAIGGGALARERAAVERTRPVVVDTASMRSAIDSLTRTNEQLRDENAHLRALTSQMTPSCDERGETRESVARIVVAGDGSYVLDGATMNVDSVFSRLSQWIEKSQAKRCRFYVDVLARPDLRANEFIAASNRLSRHFYLRRVSGTAQPSRPAR